MWQIAAGLSVGSGFMGFGASRKAAKEIRKQAQMQAAEIRKQRFQISEIASQQHLQRLDTFKDTASTNTAMAAFMGRSDRSIGALRREEARRYGQDVNRIREQERRDIEKTEAEARMTIARGQASAKAAKAQGTTSLISGLTGAAMLSASFGPKGT
jgi:polyhydroxyalkanoate synthesis regulator phasin